MERDVSRSVADFQHSESMIILQTWSSAAPLTAAIPGDEPETDELSSAIGS